MEKEELDLSKIKYEYNIPQLDNKYSELGGREILLKALELIKQGKAYRPIDKTDFYGEEILSSGNKDNRVVFDEAIFEALYILDKKSPYYSDNTYFGIQNKKTNYDELTIDEILDCFAFLSRTRNGGTSHSLAIKYAIDEGIFEELLVRFLAKAEPMDYRRSNAFMVGACIGDYVGSIYEFENIRTKDFDFFGTRLSRFTDDTVMTFAILQALLDCKGDYTNLEQIATDRMREFGRKYINAGYGSSFKNWLLSDNPTPYNSYGNGAAMRVSAVAYFSNSIEQVKELSYKVTCPTHNHEEGLKGAEATAVAIWLALTGRSKKEIKEYIEKHYYSLDFDYKTLQYNYRFNETCQETVPQAIYCFLISNSFEDAIRTAISIGGDSDTLAAITGSIAEAFYGIKNMSVGIISEKRNMHFVNYFVWKLDNKFREILKKFYNVIYTHYERYYFYEDEYFYDKLDDEIKKGIV